MNVSWRCRRLSDAPAPPRPLPPSPCSTLLGSAVLRTKPSATSTASMRAVSPCPVFPTGHTCFIRDVSIAGRNLRGFRTSNRNPLCWRGDDGHDPHSPRPSGSRRRSPSRPDCGAHGRRPDPPEHIVGPLDRRRLARCRSAVGWRLGGVPFIPPSLQAHRESGSSEPEGRTSTAAAYGRPLYRSRRTPETVFLEDARFD